MRFHGIFTFALGIAVAGGAVAYTHNILKSPIAHQPMRDVVVAAAQISFGDVIDENSLRLQAWPAHAVPPDSFSSVQQMLGADDDGKRRAKLAIGEGDIIFASKISDFNESVSITQQIDPTMRAVTIRVNDVTGVAGLVAPSDRIDLTLTRSVDQQLVTSTILQDVEVLGFDQPLRDGKRASGKAKTITVQVDPADAQKLALAQQAGTLSLSLRHIDAADRPALGSIGVGDLTEPEKAAPKKKKSRLPEIVVNRGGERSTVEVPSG